MNQTSRKKQIIVYVTVLLLSVLYIVVGHNLAVADYHSFAVNPLGMLIAHEKDPTPGPKYRAGARDRELALLANAIALSLGRGRLVGN